MQENNKILIIGGGLAGSEAAFFLANKNIKVFLVDNKTKKLNEAQKLPTCGELVCTNSLKSTKIDSAHGLLKFEMDKIGSLILNKARIHCVPAGDALSVDRVEFSNDIHRTLISHPNITFIEEDCVDPIALAKSLECNYTIMATGPLTNSRLAGWIKDHLIDKEGLYFYDAIAPIVELDSLDISKMYYKNRFKDNTDEVPGDYLNVPLSKEEYFEFVEGLVEAKKVEAHNFEDWKFFEACLPIDLMAQRGEQTLRYSCMKPIGLRTPDGKKPYAVIQLRKENLLGDSFNMVGFQNRLLYSEQLKVFRKLPGFENAVFNHLGSVHRNTFVHSHKILNWDFSSKKYSNLYLAGQITGVEGYTESAAMGLYVALNLFSKIKGKTLNSFPKESAIGALVNYVMTDENARPSSINFGLFPSIELPLEIDGKKIKGKDKKIVKKELISKRAQEIFCNFYQSIELS